MEYLIKARNGRYVWVNSANGGDPYMFDTYQDALKVQQEVGGEIMSAKEQGYLYENKLQENDNTYYYEIHFDFTEDSGKDSDGYSKFFKSAKQVEDDIEEIWNLAVEENQIDDYDDFEDVDYAQKIDADEYEDATSYTELTEAEENEEEFEEIQNDDIDELQEAIDDFKNIDKLHEAVVDSIIDDSESYNGDTEIDKIKARCEDIMNHGLVTGMVSSLVYYSDTVAFYNQYEDELYDLIDNYGPDEFLDMIKGTVNSTEILLNCDTAKNWIVWRAYEEITYQFSNVIGLEY